MRKRKANKPRTIQQQYGIRLNTPCPKIIQPKTVYNRRKKHKRDHDDLSYCLGAKVFEKKADTITTQSLFI